MGRRKVDWSEVEPLYRADVLSVAEIARQFKITDAAIRYHAKQHQWRRDLGAKVRAKTKEKLIQDLAGGLDDGLDSLGSQRARESEEERPSRLRVRLAGKNLAGWCSLDQPCHADVLLEIANR